MSALHDLERQLASAVDAGAAADSAAPVDRGLADAPSRASATPHEGRRRRRPSAGRVLVALLIAGGVTTGALAATGALRVVKEAEAPYFPMVSDVGAGVPSSPVRVLPLRVRDPQGGPPWVIRTFTTNRGAACAQAGQWYRGRFGKLERDDRNRPVFRLVGIHIGDTARCTNSVTDGLPVLRGLRAVHLVGGSSSDARCSDAAGQGGACPITAATVVRFGLLGPRAKTAQFEGPDGQWSAPLKMTPGTGGAYLFAEPIDPDPFRSRQEIEQRIEAEVERRFSPQAGAGDRAAAGALLRRRMQFQEQRYREAFASDQAGRSLAIRDGVDATFANGTTFRVAGRGVTRRALPGITPVRDDLPTRLPAPVAVKYLGIDRAVRVTFPAPVALDRYARAYVVTVRGLRGPSCDDWVGSAESWIARAPDKGREVVAVVRPMAQRGVRRWCPGQRYVVRVAHHSGTNPGGVDRPVGTTSFTAR